ncbi:class I SAM-dependent methyltransferase [Thiohalocapsa marina]|uniref:class I SAM-dependent methyltransferase n=1 Tax=Thiohalocapsa marina TaxID=424902 RepID=UPI0036D8C588
MNQAKADVHDFWDRASCGEELYLAGEDRAAYQAQAETRYALEPYIPGFAGFNAARGLRVLEIGVGLGADHQRFAEAGAVLSGIDLTERAVEHTRRRLAAFGLASELAVGDAENLQFPDESFDLVYSWGVLHHSPDTPKAIAEVWRVLKRGGGARIMVYHKWSLVGLMLWVRYALLGLKPWLSLSEIYARYLESPGTKAYTVREARELFADFSQVEIRTVLTHGDLLESAAGQRHRGALLTLARKVWPRGLIRRLLPGAGLFMLIEARK